MADLTEGDYAALARFVRGFSLRDGMDDGLALGLDESDYPTPEEDALVLGVLWAAAGLAVDYMGEEIHALVRAESNQSEIDWDDFVILGSLPPRFRPKFDLRFATDFLIALADVTSKLAHGWSRPASIAEELALDVVIGQMEVVVDLHELDLYADWQEDLRTGLFEDSDYEMLFDLSLDGFENEESGDGVMPMRFEDWFTPYGDSHAISPVFRPPLRR